MAEPSASSFTGEVTSRLPDLTSLDAVELLQVHGSAIEELKRRGIVTTDNAPLGDYAEHLVCKTFGWNMAPNSAQDVDAVDDDGTRYQIKARRLVGTGSRQLGALRRLPDHNFDFLVAILFNEEYRVSRAAVIPYQLVMDNSRYVKSTNSWLFILREGVWDWEDVHDITEPLGGVSTERRSKRVAGTGSQGATKHPRPYPKSGAGKLICDLIRDHKPEPEILVAVKQQLPDSNADTTHVAYYKTLLRNLGYDVPKKHVA